MCYETRPEFQTCIIAGSAGKYLYILPFSIGRRPITDFFGLLHYGSGEVVEVSD